MNPKYEVSEFESLEDFLKSQSGNIFCIKYEEKYILYTGEIAFETVLLDIFILDEKPKKYLGLKGDKAIFSDVPFSDYFSIVFVKSSSLTKKALDTYWKENK